MVGGIEVKFGYIVGSGKIILSVIKYGVKFGFDWDEMVEEFWYEGVDGKCVQCWMIKFMGFDEKKKYFWIFFFYGGLVFVWIDVWSI